ncbi:unnamed protein product, partial [Penicillium nalgiovense]
WRVVARRRRVRASPGVLCFLSFFFLFFFFFFLFPTCFCFAFLEIDLLFCYVWEENAVSLLQYVPNSGPFLSLVYMVMVSLLYGLLRRWLFVFFFFFAFYCFAFTLPPLFVFSLFGGSIDSVLGIRVGGVLLFFTMSCKTTR